MRMKNFICSSAKEKKTNCLATYKEELSNQDQLDKLIEQPADDHPSGNFPYLIIEAIANKQKQYQAIN
jgi:hypothetical protein